MTVSHPRKLQWFTLLIIVVTLITFGVVALLVNIFERKREASGPPGIIVPVSEVSTDPEPWGINFPLQYEGYMRTAEAGGTEYGGSNALPPDKLAEDPWLKRLYDGYAFSIEYREARGHAYMLYDQERSKRVTDVQQSGACLHCHASVLPTYRRIGLQQAGTKVTQARLADSFNKPAVMAGFQAVSRLPYEDVRAELTKTPDGVIQPNEDGDPHLGDAHPVSCVDCHDPETMAIRVTRPGFFVGIAKLAESNAPVPHLASIRQWRESGSEEPYDPNVHASRQEMRSFVCGQCHVEYYCADKMTLTYPWHNGLQMEQLEQTWDEMTFPDGSEFYDFVHETTGTKLYKAQHPEFELWSQGTHARAGVSCSDCHMPYEKQGARKVSNHWVQSPMMNLHRACQTCHNVQENELRARVDVIQDRTKAMKERAAVAMTDMLDAIIEVQAAGATERQLAPIRDLQRQAMWRLDYIVSENSSGFHAAQSAARILGESMDYSRQAQAQCYRVLAESAADVGESR